MNQQEVTLTPPAEIDGNTLKAVLEYKPKQDCLIVENWIRTEFNLPKSMVEECDQYVLRVWDGKYVYSNTLDGKFEHINEEWIIYWQSTPAVVRSAARVACSFREYKGKKYVVIKVWKGE